MSCFDNEVFETPYSSGSDVLAHTGIFFEIEAKDQAIQLETLELDVKSGLGNNLQVDVYVSDSSVQLAHTNDKAWSLVARSRLIPKPDGGEGAILPTWQFVNVDIDASARKSMYIRMKGPFLDNTVDDGKNAGSIGASNDDLAVMAGYHVDQSSEVFPSTLGTDVAPIIAGKFHYKIHADCAAVEKTTTEVEFALAIDIALQVADITAVEQATATVIDNLLSVDEKLTTYAAENALTRGAVKATMRTYTGDCPQGWNSCDAVIAKITFEHEAERTSGDIEERLYRYYLTVSQEQLKVLPTATQAAYVGFVDARSSFVLTMDGVSKTNEMDNVQTHYTRSQVVEFFKANLDSERTKMFNFYIDKQTLFDIDSIELRGTLTGAVLALESNADFANRLENTFSPKADEFVTDLKFNMNFPGPITESGRYEYFIDASNPVLEVFADSKTAAPTPAPTRNEDFIDKGINAATDRVNGLNKNLLVIIIAVVGIFAVMICCWCGFRSRRRAKQKEIERLERKAERRKRAKELFGGDGDSLDDNTTLAPPTQIAFEQDDEDGRGHDEESQVSSILPTSNRRFSRSGGNYEHGSFSNHSERFNDEPSSTSSPNEHYGAVYDETSSHGGRRYSSGHHRHDDISAASGHSRGSHGGRRYSSGHHRHDDISAASGHSRGSRRSRNRRRSTGHHGDNDTSSSAPRRQSAGVYSAPGAPPEMAPPVGSARVVKKVEDLELQALSNVSNDSFKDPDDADYAKKSILERRWSTGPELGGSTLDPKKPDPEDNAASPAVEESKRSTLDPPDSPTRKEKKKKKSKSMSHYTGDESSLTTSKHSKSKTKDATIEEEDESEHSSSPSKKVKKKKKSSAKKSAAEEATIEEEGEVGDDLL